MSTPTIALRMRGISKTFPGMTALSNVSLTVKFGRIHAIVGENGAGKSTLMKVLGGVYQPTSGTIEIAGTEVRMARPADAMRLGIRMVHQELNLAPDLTVPLQMRRKLGHRHAAFGGDTLDFVTVIL